MIYADFATKAENTRGRLHKEAESETRSIYQRDRDRVLHAGAFRRLIHKTQVFVAHVGDYYRTRLTHSLEVAQIARSMSRELQLNEELAETLALCHDLGHTPFGHSGEEALNTCMHHHGGFDHNAQSLRIVTLLEQRYAAFDGLNLTWETLEGLVKHNGPLLNQHTALTDLPFAIQEFAADMDLELHSYAGPEAQIAALADDIAYNNHDIDDGLRAGLFSFEDVMELPLVGDSFKSVRDDFGKIEARRWRHEAIRRLIGKMVGDLIIETKSRLKEHNPKSAADVRAMNLPLVSFSDQMLADQKKIKAFLSERMYKHFEVNRAMSKARRIVSNLFDAFYTQINLLPEEWQVLCDTPQSDKTARVICDYIAGMTDRYAMEEHQRVVSLSPDAD
ncbi:MAG: deoxyguanosinetriphosphate triphosphohydrolase [Parvibaculales bacterium]